ncbi:interferon kappa [Paroedura picta]|uniref:interferon kappa n=1 Tax=Paroedura picta TaxID=143630 RepID=UPI0040570E4B
MAPTSQNYGLQACLMFTLFAHSSQVLLSKCPILLIQNQQMETNLQELCRTSGQFPLECLHDIVDFGFPLEVFKASNEGHVIIIKKMLHLFINFFIKDKPNDTWNSTCTRNILISLHQQISTLEKCFDSNEMQKELRNSKQKICPLILKVQSYFQRMNDFLQDKQYSPCAWEMIHVEIRYRFQLMTQVLEMLNK